MLARQINVKSHHTTFVFDTHRTGGNTELLDQTIQSQSERVCCVLVLERFSNLYTSVDTPASVNNIPHHKTQSGFPLILSMSSDSKNGRLRCTQLETEPVSQFLWHWAPMRWCWQMLAPPDSLHVFLMRWCWQMLAPPHSLHWLLWRWCGHTLRGFFFFESPASAASASSRLRRLRVLLLPTCAASSGTARCVLSPSSSSPPAAPPAAPRPPTPSSIALLPVPDSTVGRFSQPSNCRTHAASKRVN